MSYTITNPRLGMQPIAVTDTTQNHPLGTIVHATDPTYGEGEFIYLKGVASTAVGDWVSYQGSSGATTRWAGTAGEGRPLAVAMSANVANQYGWYQIAGNAVANISGTVAAGDKVFWQATAVTSSTQVNGKQVQDAIAGGANGTPASGQAVITMQRPSVQGQIV